MYIIDFITSRLSLIFLEISGIFPEKIKFPEIFRTLVLRVHYKSMKYDVSF